MLFGNGKSCMVLPPLQTRNSKPKSLTIGINSLHSKPCRHSTLRFKVNPLSHLLCGRLLLPAAHDARQSGRPVLHLFLQGGSSGEELFGESGSWVQWFGSFGALGIGFPACCAYLGFLSKPMKVCRKAGRRFCKGLSPETPSCKPQVHTQGP